MLVDYDKNNIVFPPMICATSQRPDIVIWSSMARAVIIAENLHAQPRKVSKQLPFGKKPYTQVCSPK